MSATAGQAQPIDEQPRQPLPAVIQVVLEHGELELVREAARSCGLDVQVWIRQLVLTAAHLSEYRKTSGEEP